MNLANFVIYISSFAWIFPIFRQYKTRFFYFFLILGLSDPINLLCVLELNVKSGLVHSIASLLLFYSINHSEKKTRFSYTDMLVVILFLSTTVFLAELYFITIGIHILILARFIQLFTIILHQKTEINIFCAGLVFYEITVVIKLAIYLSGTYSGVLFSYITLAFQLLIAIFFTIYREDNPHLRVKLKS
jgi:hypothetical protein